MIKKTISSNLGSMTFLVIVANILLIYSKFKPAPNNGRYLFYDLLNGNTTITLTILLLIIVPFISVYDSFISYSSGFSKYMIIRTGYVAYWSRCSLKAFIKGAIFYLLFQLIIFMTIDLFLADMTYSNKFEAVIFIDNWLEDLLIFVFLSSIGMGIVCCFLHSLIYLIYNKYQFVMILLIAQIISVVLFSFIDSIAICKYTGVENEIIKAIAVSIMPISLFQPGLSFGYGAICFFSSLLFYSVIIFSLYRSFIRKKLKYEI